MLDKEYYHAVFDKLADTWGKENQMRMCIEEMSELTKELCKYMRHRTGEKSPELDAEIEEIKKNIIEETADVLICASQMKRFFGDKAVEEVMDYKIKRVDKRVNDFIEKNKK